MLILDRHAFARALTRRGYHSVEELAKRLQIHRNTVQYYLTERPVLSPALTQILQALDLSWRDALVESPTEGDTVWKPVAPLVSQLVEAFPGFAFIIFGSRAQGRAGRYSDFDIGFCGRSDLDRHARRTMLEIKATFEETSPYFVDLVDLRRADPTFLKSVLQNYEFVGGNPQTLLKTIEEAAHEQKDKFPRQRGRRKPKT